LVGLVNHAHCIFPFFFLLLLLLFPSFSPFLVPDSVSVQVSSLFLDFLELLMERGERVRKGKKLDFCVMAGTLFSVQPSLFFFSLLTVHDDDSYITLSSRATSLKKKKEDGMKDEISNFEFFFFFFFFSQFCRNVRQEEREGVRRRLRFWGFGNHRL